MFDVVLSEQNPHWEGHLYPQAIHRECFKDILRYLGLPQVISVTGVRRAGKSTLLKQTINHLIQELRVPPKNILFANLEHPYFSQYSEDVRYLEKLFENYLRIANPQGQIFCFLDEIQFFHQWPLFVKAHYEQRNVKFLITGSNSYLMSHEMLTLLSGRTLPIEVYPLSFLEVIGERIGKPADALFLAKNRLEIRRLLDQFLHYGGFPEVVLLPDKEVAQDILNAYAKTILYQDVAARLGLKKPMDLERLFYYLSSHISVPFTYVGLAKLFEISDKTIKEYIQALIDANLLFTIDKFSYSLKSQIREPKKAYSIDMGMVNATAFKFSENRGRLFENALYLEFRRRKQEVYYYKTASGLEIDFLIKEANRLELVQVCYDLHEKSEGREYKAIVQAAKELGLSCGVVVTSEMAREFSLDGIAISAVPLERYLIQPEFGLNFGS